MNTGIGHCSFVLLSVLPLSHLKLSCILYTNNVTILLASYCLTMRGAVTRGEKKEREVGYLLEK